MLYDFLTMSNTRSIADFIIDSYDVQLASSAGKRLTNLLTNMPQEDRQAILDAVRYLVRQTANNVAQGMFEDEE